MGWSHNSCRIRTVTSLCTPLKDFYPIEFISATRQRKAQLTSSWSVGESFGSKLHPQNQTSQKEDTGSVWSKLSLHSSFFVPPFPDPLFTRVQRGSRSALRITESVCHSLDDHLCTFILRQLPAEISLIYSVLGDEVNTVVVVWLWIPTEKLENSYYSNSWSYCPVRVLPVSFHRSNRIRPKICICENAFPRGLMHLLYLFRSLPDAQVEQRPPPWKTGK